MTEISGNSTLSQKQSGFRSGKSVNLKQSSTLSQSMLDFQSKLDVLWDKWSEHLNVNKFNVKRFSSSAKKTVKRVYSNRV